MSEDTLTVRLNDDVSGPARVAASGVQALLSALKDLESTEVSNNAAAALDDISAAAKRGGSGAREALEDLKVAATNAANAALGAQRAWTQSGGAASGVDRVVQKLKEATSAAKRLEQAELDVARAAAKAADKAAAPGLLDRIGAANRLPTALQAGAAPKAQTGFGQLLGVVNKLFGSDAAGGLARGAATLTEAADKLGPAGPALLQGGKLLALGAAAVGVAAVALVAAAAVVAYKLLEAGLQLAIAQTSIRQSFESSISKMVGGAQAAKDIFNTAIKVAVDLGLDKEAVLAKTKELVGVGFRGAEINTILRVRADVAAGGSEERANAFQKYLEKLKSGKAFTSIDELAEAGISADRVLAKLSETLGVKVDKVKELLKAGKIDVQTGMQAVIAAAQGQYGGAAGGAAATIPAKLQGLKTLFESMFDSVDLSGIKGALDSVMKVFSGPDGEKFKGAVNKLFGTISDIFGKAFSGPEGEARLQRFLTGITKLMEGAAVIIESAGPRIIKMLDGISKLVDRNGASTGGSWLKSIAAGLLDISGSMMGVDFGAFATLISGAMDMAVQAMNKAVDTALSIGSDIIQGLINGIMNMGPNVASALGGVVQSAIDKANKLLGRASPAKATIAMGQDTGMGMVIGLNRMRPMVANAGQSMAASALAGVANDNAVPAAASATAGASGGAGMTVHIHVNSAPGDSREHAQAQGAAAGEAFSRQLGGWVRTQRRAA